MVSEEEKGTAMWWWEHTGTHRAFPGGEGSLDWLSCAGTASSCLSRAAAAMHGAASPAKAPQSTSSALLCRATCPACHQERAAVANSQDRGCKTQALPGNK